MLTVLKYGRVTLELDTEDPDTPAMVYVGKESATYHCAVDTGVVETYRTVDLTDSELAWLDSHMDAVDEAFDTARSDEWMRLNG